MTSMTRRSCLIEVCIFVALLYGAVWLIGPGVDLYLPPRGPCSDGSQIVKQRRTVADMRNTGTALLSWLADRGHTPGTAREPAAVSLNAYRRIDPAEIYQYLNPRDDLSYLQVVPDLDGWQNQVEVYFLGDALPPQSVLIRSAGCQGVFQGPDYETGAFVSTDYEQDIVWADGRFVRWPD